MIPKHFELLWHECILSYLSQTEIVRSEAMRSDFSWTVQMAWVSIGPTIGLKIAAILAVNKEARSDVLGCVFLPCEVKTSFNFEKHELCSIFQPVKDNLEQFCEGCCKVSWIYQKITPRNIRQSSLRDSFLKPKSIFWNYHLEVPTLKLSIISELTSCAMFTLIFCRSYLNMISVKLSKKHGTVFLSNAWKSWFDLFKKVSSNSLRIVGVHWHPAQIEWV